MLSLITFFRLRLSFSLLVSGSCIGYVDGDHVGFQHLYSEALLAFRMNVDLLGLGRSSGHFDVCRCISAFFRGLGDDASGYACAGGHERGVRFMSMIFLCNWLVRCFEHLGGHGLL